MSIEIRTVDWASPEARAVYRLRYDVYVDELARTQRFADHDAREIVEPLDRDAVLLAAYDDGAVVGSVRVNYARDTDLADYAALYRMYEDGAAHPTHTSVTTKMLVAKPYRNGPLGYRLAAAAYTIALRDGILYDFIDCYPPRLPFFERLGYQVRGQAVHAEYGEVTVMRIAVRDAVHLRAVHSPFLRYLARERAAA
jgi:GNAT superfamily N-acetyltransferase